jgi:hypothetical protein
LFIAEAGDFVVLVHRTLVSRPFVLSLFITPCQYTPLLNLRRFIFGLTPFGWLRSVNANDAIIFYLPFFIYAYFSGTYLGRKRRAGCI